MPNYTVIYTEIAEYAEVIEAKNEYEAYQKFRKDIDTFTPSAVMVDDVDIA